MKTLPDPKITNHPSHRTHRRQVWTQILLPVLIGAAALVVGPLIAWLAVFDGGGDVGRWAAISTMWVLLPVMIAGAILLVVLIVLIFVAGRIAGWIPRYSLQAQRFAAQAAGGTRRAAAMIRTPVLAVRGFGSRVKTGLQRLRERI
ncbi:MAG: hypothetical protein V1755_06355 [Chloroflexota bacterium]